MMVVYFHCGAQVARFSQPPLPLHAAGEFGVDVFFVISGVVMWMTTWGRDMTPWMFFQRRLERIAPLYWIVTLLVASVAFAAPALMQSTIFDWRHLIASLAFAPWPNPAGGGLTPVLIPGWTLNYEMFFYVLFAGALALPATWRLSAVLAALAACVALGAGAPEGGLLRFYGDPILLEFGAGVVIGRMLTAPGGPPAEAALAVVAAGLALAAALTFAPWAPRALAAGAPAALVVGGLALAEKARGAPRWRALLAIGDASYSIYLTHALTLAVVSLLWRRTGASEAGAGAYYLVAMLASLAVGWLAYVLIERPINLRLHARRRAAAQAA